MNVCTSPECAKPIPADDAKCVKYGLCYRHRIFGIGITFTGGGGYGREQFHAMNNREFMAENDIEGSVPR